MIHKHTCTPSTVSQSGEKSTSTKEKKNFTFPRNTKFHTEKNLQKLYFYYSRKKTQNCSLFSMFHFASKMSSKTSTLYHPIEQIYLEPNQMGKLKKSKK